MVNDVACQTYFSESPSHGFLMVGVGSPLVVVSGQNMHDVRDAHDKQNGRRTTVMTSTAFPVATMMPSVQRPLIKTTVKGTNTPQTVRKANHKNATNNTMPT